jgi:RimJ/RimL family protein N-acetyltransferase
MDIPRLRTKRLELLAPSICGLDAYQKFYSDPNASLSYGGPISNSQIWSRLKSDLGSWHLSGFGVWMIRVKDSRSIVGTCGFWQGLDWPRELTWWLLPTARGRGYAYEASIAAISHAYDNYLWHKVETYMNDDNKSAKRLVERLGGTRTQRARFPDGEFRDMYHLPRPPLS